MTIIQEMRIVYYNNKKKKINEFIGGIGMLKNLVLLIWFLFL